MKCVPKADSLVFPDQTQTNKTQSVITALRFLAGARSENAPEFALGTLQVPFFYLYVGQTFKKYLHNL